MRCIGVLLSLCVATTASAKGKPIVDSSRYVDESTVYMELGTASEGYWVTVTGYGGGFAEKDRVRLDVRLAGKAQFSYPCRWSWESRTARFK